MPGKPRVADHRTAQEPIVEWLRAELAAGAKSAAALRDSAAAAGHSWRALQHGAERLGIERTKVGMAGGWIWGLLPSPMEGDISNGVFDGGRVLPDGQAVTCLAAYGYVSSPGWL